MSNIIYITRKWPKGFWTEVTSREFVRAWKAYLETFNDPIRRVNEGKITGPQVTYFSSIPLFRVTCMCNTKKNGYYINSEHVKYVLNLAEEKLGPIVKKTAEVIDFQEFLDMRYK